ncbi:hypothetical protein EDB89DRAFT_2244129 [Lactarius sanguifluus]|nr:hypothetical protein EDB89DRAFT_2244129 [Lactarius sanguifluus]
MSRQVAGCCVPCRGGMGVGGCKGEAGRQGLAGRHAVTGRQGLARCVGATWRVGGDGVLAWRGVAGRQGLARRRAVTGRQGLVRHVGATWWVGGGGVLAWRGVAGWQGLTRRHAVTGRRGLVHHVGATWRVGGGRVLAWQGVAGRGALHAVLGWRGGLVGCWGRDEWACNVQGLACRVGAARRVGGGDTLGRGQMEVASVHQRGAMTCNVQVRHVLITSEDGRGAWKGESGEVGQGVEVGAQAGGLRPLPPPCAREPPPFVPTPTRRSDMARNTPPPPTH